jgi:hypothetical protein
MPSIDHMIDRGKAFVLWDGLAAYQLVGGVKAYQGIDE